jgi:hypothetical protein
MNKKNQPNVNNIFPKNNYDIDSLENIPLFSNIPQNNDKKQDFIIFPKDLKFEEKPDLNRISNINDNELPLEDKLQIQKQIDEDNDNDDQIEVIENILSNFGKEKFSNKKFLLYKKGQKNKYKSNSVVNSNNKILNKIKKDIALINFQQEINKIHKLHNYKIFLKSERAHLNTIRKNHFENNFNNESGSKNKKRIEEIKNKLYSKSKESKSNSKNSEIKKLINTFNINRKKENFFNTKKEKAFNQILEGINNLKQMKINRSINNCNKNNNNNTNYVCNTFRSMINYDYFKNKKNNNEIQRLILPVNNSKKNKNKNQVEENNDYLKTEDSTNISIYNSNQFFYSVYNHAIKKYPYLYLLKNKINKMKTNDLSKSQKKTKDKKEKEENKSLLDKINSQRDIFQREIDKYNSK